MSVATEGPRAGRRRRRPSRRLPGNRPSSGSGQRKTISVFGDQISALAIPLTAVLALDASALEVGILTALAWLPHLLFSLPVGVWIDRRAHRRENMIVADLLRGVALATHPGRLVARGADDVAPAGRRLRRGSADRLLRPLERVVLRRRSSTDPSTWTRTASSARRRSLSYIAGPSTAGFLVQVFTAPVALLADALSFVGVCSRPARRARQGAEGRAQRDERAGRPGRRLPLSRAPAGAASRRRLHEHHQLLQLLHLRDLRPLREPHARAERGSDRRHPRRGLVRSSRRRA